MPDQLCAHCLHAPDGCCHNRVRAILKGYVLEIELKHDGTSVVRDLQNGFPVAINSGDTNVIERRARKFIDDIAAEAIKHPAPWPP